MNQQVMLNGLTPMISLREALAHQFDKLPAWSLDAIASRLKVSEVQLLMAACGPQVTRLACDRHELLADLACLGPVCTSTENRHAQQQQVLEYRRLRLTGNRGLLLAGDCELDLRFAHWVYGFAVSRPVRRGIEHSLHFFDARGQAVHRIRLTRASDSFAYRLFVAAYRCAEQRPGLVLPCTAPAADNHRSAATDAPASTTGRCAGCRRTIPVAQLIELLQSLVDVDLGVSFQLSNAGATHTWRGLLHSVRCSEGRLTLQAADCSLHLDQARIAGARPPCHGSTLELHTAEGETLATLIGPPARYLPQAVGWRRLLAALNPYASDQKDSQPCS